MGLRQKNISPEEDSLWYVASDVSILNYELENERVDRYNQIIGINPVVSRQHGSRLEEY